MSTTTLGFVREPESSCRALSREPHGGWWSVRSGHGSVARHNRQPDSNRYPLGLIAAVSRGDRRLLLLVRSGHDFAVAAPGVKRQSRAGCAATSRLASERLELRVVSAYAAW